MNELRQIMADTVEKLFSDQVTKNSREQAEVAIFPDELLQAITENGLLHVLVPENMGGVSGQFADAEVIARAVGRHAVPLPIVEQILANYLLASAGITPPEGITVFAPVRDGEAIQLKDGKVTGTATRIPWGRKASHVAVITDDGIALVKAGDYTLTENQNIAAEPRDTIDFENASPVESGELPARMTAQSAFALGAMMRSSQMAGAIEWILEASVQYANDRVQFGRALGKFQAIQQNMAEMAGHSAASGAAALGAFQAADMALNNDINSTFEIAAAKTRISEAAGVVTSHAHQIHGAIGFTYEHDLHFRTRRLWSWRDEFGSDSYWADWIGGHVLELEADDLWPWLTTRPT
ncbi:acyl-CoA dehydrogenase family protein [Sneathiella sp. HT1-7]|uniref:acyl-CoA dehydrogenase family protein n=1 Tax=Sneathiella sp. HT1-7 TaxID=2887192 RepID=UPI001D139057|nr:acyl-CoA dehydrogenase family protein [Sneathiella sp. HT1-7]MCC3305305.1 acyl-CoA/acyl-ACP dehydrogenase [Sneathiella sp. HT1-7]